MPTPEPKLPPKVSLEDLLRLKRHERPSREFWDRFDREMQQRVWRTLVEPQPSAWNWVRGLLARRLTWLTAGAAAILVFTLVGPGNPSVSSNQHGQLVAALPVSNISPSLMAEVAPVAPEVVAAPAASEPAASATPPNFVVVALLDAPNPAQTQKVAATVSFAAEHSDHVRYAADTLAEVAVSSRIPGLY